MSGFRALRPALPTALSWPGAICALLILASPTSPAAEAPPTFLLQWGTSGSGNGQFAAPFGFGVSSDGFVYVADAALNRVQQFTTDSVFVRKWGTTGAGPGQFDNPTDAAASIDGFVFVADLGNGRIQKFTSDGVYDSEWVPPYGPAWLATDPDAPIVYMSNSNRVTKFNTDGELLDAWAFGTLGVTFLRGLGVGPSGNVYVANQSESKVVKISPSGVVLGEWGSYGEGEGQFIEPRDIAIDADENVYVVDFEWVRKFSSTGAFLTRWGGTTGNSIGEFNEPLGVATDGSRNVYVLDTGNDRIQKFGLVPTPVTPTSWGRIKSLYR